PLMYAVLDGEATPQELHDFERLLAEDPAFREEYNAVRQLFAQLKSVLPLDPPAGLADAAANRLRTSTRTSSASRTRGTMSRNPSKRAFWIGAAVALAAAVVVGFVAVEFPGSGKDTAGTVAPAQRYRAEQIKAEDVKLGDQAVTQMMQSEAFER